MQRGRRRRAARRRPRPRRHELDPRRRPGRGGGGDPDRARRGRPAERRPLDARGAGADRGGRARRPAALPRRAVRLDAPGRGRPRPGRGRRRRDGRRDAPLRPDRPGARCRRRTRRGRYVVATVHREANVRPERLRRIVDGLSRLDEPVVFPAHPRTAAVLRDAGIAPRPNVELREPLGYLAFASAASQARVVATDSGRPPEGGVLVRGAVRHDAPSTEWVDTVAVGANVLVDDDPDAIERAVRSARFPADAPTLYGDGHAARRIATAVAGLSGELTARTGGAASSVAARSGREARGEPRQDLTRRQRRGLRRRPRPPPRRARPRGPRASASARRG